MPQPTIDRNQQAQINRTVDDRLRSSVNVLMSQRRLIWRSLLNGIFTGLGGVVGATLGVALLLFILQQFGGIPLVGRFFETLGETIKSR